MKVIITKNIRFWTLYRGSWVVITLKPGQTLEAGFSCRTDEGHHYERSQWHYDGEKLIENWQNGGRDCDGPIHRSGSSICQLDALEAIPAYDDGTSDCRFNGKLIMRPDFKEYEPTRIEDEYAQRMNY